MYLILRQLKTSEIVKVGDRIVYYYMNIAPILNVGEFTTMAHEVGRLKIQNDIVHFLSTFYIIIMRYRVYTCGYNMYT